MPKQILSCILLLVAGGLQICSKIVSKPKHMDLRFEMDQNNNGPISNQSKETNRTNKLNLNTSSTLVEPYRHTPNVQWKETNSNTKTKTSFKNEMNDLLIEKTANLTLPTKEELHVGKQKSSKVTNATSIIENVEHFVDSKSKQLSEATPSRIERNEEMHRVIMRNHIPRNSKNTGSTVKDKELSNYNANNTKDKTLFIRHKEKGKTTCNISVLTQSKTYFHSQLLSKEPHFVQFTLALCNRSNKYKPNKTENAFQPLRWVWTMNSSFGPFPFLSWNLDYGLLSFKLLEAKTINVRFVCLNITKKCIRELTFGEYNTSLAIASALTDLVNITEAGDYLQYPENYFCYLSVRKDTIDTLHYRAAQYLNFPISYIGYNCCTASADYEYGKFNVQCENGQHPLQYAHSWVVTNALPYVFGILILLYFPVLFFETNAWLAKDERILANTSEINMYEISDENLDQLENMDEDNWQFADGSSPLTIGSVLSSKSVGLGNFPILVSRLRRFVVMMLFPILIYSQLLLYSSGMGTWDKHKITIKNLVKVGTPMGFLSLLADAEDRKKVFVPILGGPDVLVILYYVLSLMFIVLPRSVKQVVEDGIPQRNLVLNSPLFFSIDKIIEMSEINLKRKHRKPGYDKAVSLMKCRFYMLFTSKFWTELVKIQFGRITFLFVNDSVLLKLFLCIGLVPFYIVICVIEILCCIIFHGLPFSTFVSVLVSGATTSLRHLRGQSPLLTALFKYRISAVLGAGVVSLLYLVYIYIICLIYIVSFGFLSQIIIYCFVAVIIYPSVAFGYLFFFIVLLYYFIKLIGDFGDGYTELLATAVDISKRNMNDHVTMSLFNGHLTVSNVKAEHIREIKVNGRLLDVSENVLRTLRNDDHVMKIKMREHVYGIPKSLFLELVSKHRPVHQQLLSLVFKSIIMLVFVTLTLSITSNYVSGPTTEISEVMHVIFIVAVGALPELIQAVVSRSNSVLVREIEEREIEKSIEEYWSKLVTNVEP